MRTCKVALLICFLFSGTLAYADGPTTQPVDGTAPAIYLAAPNQFPQEYECPLLMRELPRQAMLLAARNEMGLYTHDGVMREFDSTALTKSFKDAQGKPGLLMDFHYQVKTRRLNISLFAMDGGKTNIGSQTFLLPSDSQNLPSVAPFVEMCEPFSRERYVEILKAQGYTAHVKPVCNDPITPAEEKLLYQTSLLAPFSAIQQIDADITAHGESPARLGALVRAYANLGQLTRFQWSSIHKVMTARSLLYAQRMIHNDPDSALAYYHRAYAFTFAGLHAAALKDLAHAGELQAAAKEDKKAPPPDWVRLLEPACRYDLLGIIHNLGANDRRTPLATLLLFVDNRNCGSVLHIMDTGDIAMKSNPSCFCIIDGMTSHAGVSAEHTLTELAPRVMFGNLGNDIGLLPAVPQSVQTALKKLNEGDPFQSMADVCESLVKADAAAEPSYAVAGRILQETNFSHVMRRAHFMARDWGVSSDEFVREAAPLIEGHPLKAYIDSLALPRGQQTAALTNLEVVDPQMQMVHLLVDTSNAPDQVGKMTGSKSWFRAQQNVDNTSYDLEDLLATTNTSYKDATMQLIKRVLDVSPSSTPAIAALINVDWEHSEPRLDELTKNCKDDPGVLFAIGKGYVKTNQIKKAEVALSHLVEIAADSEHCQYLASIYLADGDEEHWLSTLKLVLNEPDYALNHSKIEEIIAYHFMATGHYDTARQYADASMKDSGAQWAMIVDSLAAEFQGDFDAAEQLRKEETERYGGASWYLWCKRTGHGDVANAQKAADAYVSMMIEQRQSSAYAELATILQLEHRLGDARRLYKADMQVNKVADSGFHLADLCQEMKDPDGRKEALQYIIDNCQRARSGIDQTGMVSLAKLMLDAGDTWPTKEDFNKLVPQMTQGQCSEALYFRARQFQLGDRKDAIVSEFKQVVEQNQFNLFDYFLACDALHQLGEQTELKKVEPQPAKK